MERFDAASRARIERLLLWHLLCCAPFAVPWMLFPETFGRPNSEQEVVPMRILLLLVGASLALRSWIILKRIGGFPWSYFWPVLDVAFITAGAYIGYAKPDSWIILMYVLPVLQAAATLDLRWSISVATLGAAALGWVHGLENLQYSYFLFSLALLILVASMVTRLARGLVRARARLEVAQYRTDLAAEMHDGLQQYLGAIAMRLEFAESRSEKEPAEAARIAASAKDIARTASDELRLMLHRLRSPLLERGTLEDALRYLAALFGERTGLNISLDISGRKRTLAPKQEHALLRIAQEALANVAKHAEAATVRMSLEYGANEAKLRVADDGRGLPEGLRAGMGMETMKNRAEMLEGRVTVTPGEGGRGTSVEARIPLA
jgi:signal transduction histidine kinase